MNDPEEHRLFTARLDADPSMRREIEILKASLRATGPRSLSAAMHEFLADAEALPAGYHTGLREISDLVAVELAYKLREAAAVR